MQNELKQFKAIFPLYEDHIDLWSVHGHDSIKLRIQGEPRMELIFSYRGPSDWSLETMDAYYRNTKKINNLTTKLKDANSKILKIRREK